MRSLRFQPLIDDPHCSAALANFHRANANLVVGSDHRHLIAPLQLRYGALRNEQRTPSQNGDGADAAGLSGPENIAGVGKRTHDLDGPGLGVHLPVGEENPPFVAIHAAIRED